MKAENMKNKISNRNRNSGSPIIRMFSFAAIFAAIIPNSALLAQNKGNSATQSVILEVKPIAKIFVAGNPSAFVINDNNNSVSDENTKYSLVTNVDNMKIVASIDNPMPAGTRLLVKLSSSKASSTGSVDVSSALTPLDVVRGIGRGSDVDQSISYTFAANDDVENIAMQSRTITLTLTN